MNYNIAALNLAQDIDGVVFDVGSLYTLFGSLTDQRQRRGRRYELAVILVALVLAKLAGETTPSGIADWVAERQALFLESFELKGERMQHHNTYRRVLKSAVKVDELEQVAQGFLGALPQTGTPVQICLDGKTVRGTIAFGETRGLHLLAAYLPGRGERRYAALPGTPHERGLHADGQRAALLPEDRRYRALDHGRRAEQLIAPGGGPGAMISRTKSWFVKDNSRSVCLTLADSAGYNIGCSERASFPASTDSQRQNR